MKWLWIVLGIAALIALFVFFIRGRGGEMVMAADLDAQIVQPYIRAVAEGDTQGAYDMLSEEYRHEVPFEKFRAAIEKRKSQMGVIGQARLIRDKTLHNLFTRRRTIHLGYDLEYDGSRDTGWVILEEGEKDRFVIEGTYRRSASGNLDFVVW